MPRKHLIASGINKKQQQQAKVWMKCAKEIKAAAKAGGSNLDANPRLKAAVARALQCNLSRDSIEKNIHGANKDNTLIKECFYEGYGPNGIAILIKALTDNEQRTVSAIRGYFSKFNGQLAKPNSVKNMFVELGEIIIDLKLYSEDEIINLCCEINVDDYQVHEDSYVLYSSVANFSNVLDYIEKNKINVFSSEIKFIPNSYVVLNKEHLQKYDNFINACENDDDIQWVTTNYEEK